MNDEQIERNANILRLRLEGKSLEEIGKMYGVTRERIRQIVNRELRRVDDETDEV